MSSDNNTNRMPTLDRRIAAGKLEHFKDGGRVLIDDAQIEEYKAKHRVAFRLSEG